LKKEDQKVHDPRGTYWGKKLQPKKGAKSGANPLNLRRKNWGMKMTKNQSRLYFPEKESLEEKRGGADRVLHAKPQKRTG